MFVYLITNTVNGKYYVGKTECSVSRRWIGHRYESRHGSGNYLHRAMRRYGVTSFTIETLATASSSEELTQFEKLWILALRSYDRANGYNLTFGGEGVTQTPEIRQKISVAQKGKPKSYAPWNKGKKGVYSDETLLKMSERKKGGTSHMKGKTHSDETREKISNKNSGKPSPFKGHKHSEAAKQQNRLAHVGPDNPFFGKTHSPDTIRRISEGIRKAKARRNEVIN